MKLYPTGPTLHVAMAGTTMVILGVVLKSTPMIGFGGAMIIAVALGRALAEATVNQLRRAGFEMIWRDKSGARGMVTEVSRNHPCELFIELRNRSDADVRGVTLRPLASPLLEVELSPQEIDLPAQASAEIRVVVRGRRVGRHGLHGLSIVARGIPIGGDALYEAPLMFANPRGVVVLPTPTRALASSARGGRQRAGSVHSFTSQRRGEGDELRELRDHVPGDPFKRIAWKASARRGTLLVRDTEQETEDVIWVFLDASTDLASGRVGQAPLDLAIDGAASIFASHLRRGRAGLYCYASRMLARVAPTRGPEALHAAEQALLSCTLFADADRSELDESEVLRRVLEHLRPLDPLSLGGVSPSDIEGVATRADSLKQRAPFTLRLPEAPHLREARLRHYLAAFGIESPPKNEDARPQSEFQLAVGLRSLLEKKQSPPGTVCIIAPVPRDTELLLPVLRALRKARVSVEWRPPPVVLPSTPGFSETVARALRTRADLEEKLGMRAIRRAGVTVRPLREIPEPLLESTLKEAHERSA
ncbi:MAG: DUF58 domain-containing protein [Polyangiaceae bacterium]